MKLADVSIRRPVFAFMMSAAIVVLGLASYSQLGLDLMPKTDFPMVMVRVGLPGASSEEVETQITKPIEEVVNTIAGIDELRASSDQGMSNCFITFVLEKDIETAVQDLKRARDGEDGRPCTIETDADGRGERGQPNPAIERAVLGGCLARQVGKPLNPAWLAAMETEPNLRACLLAARVSGDLPRALVGKVQDPQERAIIEVSALLHSDGPAALKRLASPTAQVLRDGEIQTIAAKELVPGDLVMLEAGNIIPADLKLLDVSRLKVEEAADVDSDDRLYHRTRRVEHAHELLDRGLDDLHLDHLGHLADQLVLQLVQLGLDLLPGGGRALGHERHQDRRRLLQGDEHGLGDDLEQLGADVLPG